MYVFGGIEYNQKEMRRRNDLYKMWMTIPKLSEICWDAITYYNPYIDYFDRDTLLKAGIPEMFVNRVGHNPLSRKFLRDSKHTHLTSSDSTSPSKRLRSLLQ